MLLVLFTVIIFRVASIAPASDVLLSVRSLLWTGHFSSHVIAAGYSGFYSGSKMDSVPQGQFLQMLIQLMGLVKHTCLWVCRISVRSCVNYAVISKLSLFHVSDGKQWLDIQSGHPFLWTGSKETCGVSSNRKI